MTQALTYVEVDVPHCANTYGVSPCRARLMSDSYTQIGINFDGTNDYLTRGSDLSTSADGKNGLLSVWIRVNGGNGTDRFILTNSGLFFYVRINSTNHLQVVGFNSAASLVLNYVSNTFFLSGEGWHHILITWTLNISRLQCYIDDVLDTGGTATTVNDNIDYTRPDWSIGADVTGANKFNGDLADLWFEQSGAVDLGTTSTRRLFVDAFVRPVDLGTTGNTPFGFAPQVYMSGALASWQTNKGVGGGFTVHGALTAAAGDSDEIKCFNTRNTCQDIDNYLPDDPLTLRFAKATSYLPREIFAIPSLTEVQLTPAIVSLGQDLGQRASVSVEFMDHPDDDTIPGLDPYLSERTYDAFSQGTFWGKFRARNPFLIGADLRLIFGYLGQDLADMETRHYIIDSYEGPSARGKFTLRATDVLKLSDAEKAQAPAMSPGYLLADITTTSTELTVTPSGAGDSYTSGYLNIGGSEIASYWIDGNESTNVLLLHCEGADASTTFTDSSAVPHTVTPVGNAQIDTAQFKFGTSAGLFDGTGDYLQLDGSSDFAFGSGDFTIDFWFRKVANGVSYVLYDGRPAATNGFYPTIYVNGADNTLRYFVNGADQIISASATTTGVFYHVALVRLAGVTRFYRDGVQLGSFTDPSVYVNAANRPLIGINSNAIINGLNGWMDEIRITKGYARWSAAFTAPISAAPVTGSDILNIPYRGQLNTVAATHSAQDRAQHVLTYISQDPAVIVNDLLTYIPNFPTAYIDLAAWQTETATYNGQLYTTYICEPTSVKQLLEECVQQMALAIWDDNINEMLRLQVLHAVVTDAFEFTEDNMLQGSVDTREQPDQRVSRVQVYFGQINPLKALSNIDNFRSTTVIEDSDSEDDYGSPSIKQIFSRWIPQLGRTVADRLGAIILGRYKNPPRHIVFEVQRYASTDAELGGGYHFQHTFVQDETGAQTFIPIQVTQLKPAADRFHVEAEEMLFDVPATDLANRTVTLDTNNYNVNLRTIHDTIYPAPAGTETVTFTILTGVIVGSHSTSLRSVEVGTWPAGTTINIVILGRIEGMGGAGGASGSSATPGLPGGTALYTRRAINLSVASGEIWGGGGGGAGNGGAGGGGAGQDPGLGANPGTATAGGAGVFGGANGGNPGLAGGNAGTGVGGAAGSAIDGVSFVTVITGPGDIRGGQIN